jgi:hypothetical protein
MLNVATVADFCGAAMLARCPDSPVAVASLSIIGPGFMASA